MQRLTECTPTLARFLMKLGAFLMWIAIVGAGCGGRDEAATSAAGAETPMAEFADDTARLAEEPTYIATEILDATGFGEPMVAAIAEIPEDWRTQGGVYWDRSSECVSNHMRLHWMAASPEQDQAVEILPGYGWQIQGTEIAMNPCPTLAIRTAREFLSAIAQRYPGATIVDYRDRPDLRSQSPAAPPGGSAWSEAGELSLLYQRNGKTVRETLTAVLNLTEIQGNVMVSAPTVYAQRGAESDWNAAIGEHIRSSLVPDQTWIARLSDYGRRTADLIAQRQRQQIQAWHSRRMAEINARGAMQRSQIIAQTNREIAQIYSNTWASSQATDDRMHRRNLEAIGEYNTYADPAGGGIVRESTSYDRVLRTESGDYISTNDPYLNPAGSEELRRIP